VRTCEYVAFAWNSGILSGGWVVWFAGAQAEFLQPFGFGLAVDDAAEESERFGDIVAVEADILPGGLGILPHPTLNIGRLVENVSSVAGLRNFDNQRLLEILSREFGICARFFCEVAVDVADDGRVWGFGGRRREGVARLELAAKPLRRTATPNVVGCSGYQ